MKSNRIMVMIMCTVVLVLLVGCGDASNESSAKSNNQASNDDAAESADDGSSNSSLKDIEKDRAEDSSEGTEDTENNKSANETKDTSNNVPAKEAAPSTNNTEASLKEEFLQKIENTKKEAEEFVATDSSTYALKKVENDRWEIWDDLLNEIYGVLKEQLSLEEMDQLKEEQRNWITSRDDSAMEASLTYKGGTQEQVKYVAVLANLTEERCYELVDHYMK